MYDTIRARMNTLLLLQNRAIKAAQEERWQDAQSLNQEILEQDMNNISALNRLGFAFLQGGKIDAAKKTYRQVLELDSTNAVAKKYLDIAKKSEKNDQPLRLPKAMRPSDFIDEPGKTKSISLVRLADANVIEKLSVGADCEFKLTQTRISVQCEGQYIGTIPDDVFARLQPLLEAGNTYSIKIQSLKNGGVRLFIRELQRAKGVEHIASFPNETLNLMSLDHAEIAREDEEPVMVSETGEDDHDDQILETRDIDEVLGNHDDFGDEEEEAIEDDSSNDDL